MFPAGTEVIIQSVTFTVRDDDLPEGDEAFPVQLLVTNGHGVVGAPDIATVVIVTNDEAFGIFGFTSVRNLLRLSCVFITDFFNIRTIDCSK